MKTTVGFADHKFEKGGILVQSATHNYIYAYCSLMASSNSVFV